MQVASTDSAAVTTVYVCGYYVYNLEDTCKTKSLHVRRLNASFVECQEKETGLLLAPSNAHKQTGRWQQSKEKATTLRLVQWPIKHEG